MHIEVVEDPETIQRLLIDIGRRVTKEVLIAHPGAGHSVELHEESNAKDRDLLAAGVTRRTLFHDRRVDHVPTVRTVEALEPLGAEFRTLPVVPFRLMVFDRVIASRLDISVRTCRRHIAVVFEKLGAESRFQAGALAVQRGWVTPRGARP